MSPRASTPQQRIGEAAELQVATRLEASGWRVLGRNVRVGRDELDLVAVDPGPPAALVVVEVRRRARRDYGLAEETLDHRKRGALRRAVGTLLERGALPDGSPLPRLPLRVDLVALDVDAAGHPSVRHHRGIALGGRGPPGGVERHPCYTPRRRGRVHGDHRPSRHPAGEEHTR